MSPLSSNESAPIHLYTLSLHDALPIWMPDRTEANPNELNQEDARYGFRCCHLKNITSIILIKLIDRKSGSAGMPRPTSYAVFCLKKKRTQSTRAARRWTSSPAITTTV